MSKTAYIVGGLAVAAVSVVALLFLTSNTSAQAAQSAPTSTQSTDTTNPENTGTQYNIINGAAIASTFPNAVVNEATGLITTGNIPINEITGLQGQSTSTNTTTLQPNQVVGTENLNSVGGPSNATVFSLGSTYQGAGEYVSVSGAPEYISSLQQFQQQQSLGYL